MMKISIALNIMIDKNRPVSDLDRFMALGLVSIQKFFDIDLIDKLIVVAPGINVEECRLALSNVYGFNIEVIDEDVICPSLKGRKGWYKQQVLKLAISQYINTDWYLTFDSDVLCTRRITEDFLFNKDKAIWQKEPAREHMNWWIGSAELLKLQSFHISPEQKMIGVTPALLHTHSTIRLINYIGEIYTAKPWESTLIESSGLDWTEYSLYWMYLLHLDIVNDLYCDLDRYLYSLSIWFIDDLDQFRKENLSNVFQSDSKHGFMVFQSNLDISLGYTVKLLRPYLTDSPKVSYDEYFRWKKHWLIYIYRKTFYPIVRTLRSL